jgi:flavin reductase
MLTGAPALDGALVAFDCRISRIVEVGTHDIFICAVEAVEVGAVHEGLIYYARGYHRVVRAG